MTTNEKSHPYIKLKNYYSKAVCEKEKRKKNAGDNVMS